MTDLRTAAQAVLDAVHSEHCLLEYRDCELIEALENALKSEGIAPPDGWVLVPIEPTDAMVEAGAANGDNPYDYNWLIAIDTYKDMIAAAPKQEVKL